MLEYSTTQKQNTDFIEEQNMVKRVGVRENLYLDCMSKFFFDENIPMETCFWFACKAFHCFIQHGQQALYFFSANGFLSFFFSKCKSELWKHQWEQAWSCNKRSRFKFQLKLLHFSLTLEHAWSQPMVDNIFKLTIVLVYWAHFPAFSIGRNAH